jgi:subtilisin family serine protease
MDGLIVDLRHSAEVMKLLDDEPELRPVTKEEDHNLDLMLVGGFADLRPYADRVRRRYANEIAALEIPPAFDLDVLMYDLRTRFARDFGFVPVMDKNADTVIGLPQHKGIADPLRAAGPALTSSAAQTDGNGVRVGVVDTALMPHPSFPPDLVTGNEIESTVPGTGLPALPPPVLAAHAAFVVGLIRFQAPAARILVRAGLRADRDTSTVWHVARKIAELRDQHLDVVNLSFGVADNEGAPPMALARAIDRLGPDVLVVAAAGNRKGQLGEPKQIWPAAMTDVVAVGAKVGANGAFFSMTGPWVDCTAEGVHVTSTFPATPVQTSEGVRTFDDGRARWSGTSFATATVTGAIAARMSRNPGMKAREAFAVLLADAGADPVSLPAPVT